MSDYQKDLINYVMKYNHMSHDEAVIYCEKNLIRWGEM